MSQDGRWTSSVSMLQFCLCCAVLCCAVLCCCRLNILASWQVSLTSGALHGMCIIRLLACEHLHGMHSKPLQGEPCAAGH